MRRCATAWVAIAIGTIVLSSATGAIPPRAVVDFPTDVLGGAALGTGVGWLVAELHPQTP